MVELDQAQVAALRQRVEGLGDPAAARELLFDVLGLRTHLEARRVVEVTDLPIRCEVYEADRTAPVVYFLPGIGTYVEMYCELLHGLALSGLNVVGIDPPGHGYSGGPRGSYRPEAVARAVSAAIDKLGKRFTGPVALFGSSIGAMLALATAERDERVRALLCHTLVLTECPPDLVHLWGWSSLAWSGLLAPAAQVPLRTFVDVDRLLAGNPLGTLVDLDDRIVWTYPVRTLSSVFSRRCRVIDRELGFRAGLLVGDRDEVVPIDYERYIVRRMRHPFDLIVVPGGGHMLPFDPVEDTTRIAGRWLRSALA